MNLLKFFLIVTTAFLLSACEPQHRPRATRPKPHKTEQKEVQHLSDGRYAYHDLSSDIWYYYYIWNAMSPSSSYNYYSCSESLPSLPRNGGWMAAPKEAAPNLEDAKAELKEVVENENGQIETAEEAHGEQMEFEFAQEVDAQNDAVVEANTSEATSESSSNDSSSSSSDSGGDSGGFSD